MTHLLFYGTAGTGKTTCAKAIANYLYGSQRTGNILELNASDERGIDIVKEQIKSGDSMFYNQLDIVDRYVEYVNNQ